jgi:hypothetical protein
MLNDFRMKLNVLLSYLFLFIYALTPLGGVLHRIDAIAGKLDAFGGVGSEEEGDDGVGVGGGAGSGAVAATDDGRVRVWSCREE